MSISSLEILSSAPSLKPIPNVIKVLLGDSLLLNLIVFFDVYLEELLLIGEAEQCGSYLANKNK